MKIYRSRDEVDFPEVGSLPAMPLPERLLMVSPDHFDVLYVINPHMQGQVGRVDKVQARAEWEAVALAYRRLGIPITVLKGLPGLPDMVFCANQSLPFADEGGRQVWMSRMHTPQRRGEVEPIEAWYWAEGYSIVRFEDPSVGDFEGMGDALWHPGRRLLWGGFGFRSSLAAYREISRRWGVPVAALELRDPEFYHLDTCLSALDGETALICPGAFTAEGLELIRRLWRRVIEAPEEEARQGFACNAHCPDGRHVLLPAGCPVTAGRLEAAGYRVIVLETGEFLKAGGSIFCMKMMVF